MKKTLVLFVVLGLFIFNNNVYAKWHPFSHAGEDATKPLAESLNKFTDTFGNGWDKVTTVIGCVAGFKSHDECSKPGSVSSLSSPSSSIFMKSPSI